MFYETFFIKDHTRGKVISTASVFTKHYTYNYVVNESNLCYEENINEVTTSRPPTFFVFKKWIQETMLFIQINFLWSRKKIYSIFPPLALFIKTYFHEISIILQTNHKRCNNTSTAGEFYNTNVQYIFVPVKPSFHTNIYNPNC